MASDEELDALIEEATVDAYGDEGYETFVVAFEERVRFPIEATLAGVVVPSNESTSTATSDEVSSL